MYRVHRNAIQPNLMNEIVTHYDRAQQGEGDNYAKDETYTKMVYSDFFYEKNPRMQQVVERMAPPGYRPLFDIFFETKADVGKDHHWHLGTFSAFFMEDPKMLTLWIPTRPANAEVGGRLICSRRVELGQHLNRMLTHCVREDIQFSYADMLATMTDVFEDGRLIDDFEVGDCLMFNSLIPHKGEGYHGEGSRSVYVVRYVPQDATFDLAVCRDFLARNINPRLFERILASARKTA